MSPDLQVHMHAHIQLPSIPLNYHSRASVLLLDTFRGYLLLPNWLFSKKANILFYCISNLGFHLVFSAKKTTEFRYFTNLKNWYLFIYSSLSFFYILFITCCLNMELPIYSFTNKHLCIHLVEAVL